jgi:exodeoxyribonuclease VII large subunit
MLHGFTERFPTRVLVWPVRVQGETCGSEVAAAIAGFNALEPGGAIARPDVLIVARGGGSLEDLMGFNEEIVVRAVAASLIPVISAVGHETDWTLIDLVADARAPTPTKAAEWVVPKFADLAENSDKLGLRLATAARRALQSARAHLKAAVRGLPRLEDILALPRQRFDACEKRLSRALLLNTRAHHTRYVRLSARLRPGALSQRIAACGRELAGLDARAGQALRNGIVARRRQLDGHAKLLGSLSYQSVLERGFALVRDDAGRTVRAAASLHPGDRLQVEFRDGRAEVETRTIDLSGAPSTTEPARQDPGVRRSGRRGGGGQGSLF